MLGVLNWGLHPIQNGPTFVLVSIIVTLLFVALMATLHRLPPQGKKWLTIVCTFVAGLFYLGAYLLPTKPDAEGNQVNFLSAQEEIVTNIFIIVLSSSLFIGLISLGIVHGRRLFRRLPGWHNSLAFFIAFFAILIAGFWSQLGASKHAVANQLYHALFDNLLVNLDAAMFALLAFYIASASYRAFRVRTVEAALLMFSALIVMLGMVSFGVALTSWISPDSSFAFLRIEAISSWLLSWVNMPAQRGVLIGVAVGFLAMAMRLWLSLERGSFFSGEKS